MANPLARFTVIIQDQCLEEEGAYSIDEILAFGSIESFIRNAKMGRPVQYDAAFKIFQKTKLKSLIEKVRKMRFLENLDFDVYFLTPLALLRETDLFVAVKECSKNLGIERLRYLYEENKVREKLINLLSNPNYDFHILIADKRVLNALKLDRYLKRAIKVFLISDSPLFIEDERILTLYPSKYFEQKLGTIINKRNGTIYSQYLDALIHLIKLVAKRKISLDYLIGNVNRPEDLIEILQQYLKSQETIDRYQKERGTITIITYLLEILEGVRKLDDENFAKTYSDLKIMVPGMELACKLAKEGFKLKLIVFSPESLRPSLREFLEEKTNKRTEVEIVRGTGLITFLVYNDKIVNMFVSNEISQQIKINLMEATKGSLFTICYWPTYVNVDPKNIPNNVLLALPAELEGYKDIEMRILQRESQLPLKEKDIYKQILNSVD